MQNRYGYLLLIFVLALGCSSSRRETGAPPDKEAVLADINSTYKLSPRDLMMKVGRVGAKCFFLSNGQEIPMDLTPSRDMAVIVAERAGYLNVTSDGKEFWKIDLTEKGRALMKQNWAPHLREPYGHETGNGCDYYQADLPIARAIAVEITAVRPDVRSCEYDFLWRWEPTELASILRQDSEILSKLTPVQKEDLSRHVNAFGDSPPLPVPFPVNAENTLNKRTAILEKGRKDWGLAGQHP